MFAAVDVFIGDSFFPVLQKIFRIEFNLYTKLIYFFETLRVDRKFRLFFNEFQSKKRDENLKKKSSRISICRLQYWIFTFIVRSRRNTKIHVFHYLTYQN